ncbi:DUF2231 domain-containing protein [Nesterenkonia sp. Act20]|uniref:DUF2231 domain-containing protein n=1 Tax=Nesterenkonia sp. Act20 TaxID=1483432 RepID=UPI001C43DC78|nr:DUF2231 domain-containing protein [Nesterenkonia sp. Act20]
MDLSLHPLIVHLAVVLVPLATVLLGLAFFIPRLRDQIGALAAVLALLGIGAFVLAHRSGTELAGLVGVPHEHLRWADPALGVTITFGTLTALWYVLWLTLRRPRHRSQPRLRAATTTLGLLALGSGIIACVFTVLLGHSGGEAVWSNVPTAPSLWRPL